jgi:hypothetical protein
MFDVCVFKQTIVTRESITDRQLGMRGKGIIQWIIQTPTLYRKNHRLRLHIYDI